MKQVSRKVLVLIVFTLFIAIGLLDVSQIGAAVGEESVKKPNDFKGRDWQDDESLEERSQDEERDEDESEDEDYDENLELQWQLAEQSMIAQAIELSADAALDEVKTAVVAATLLLEHADLATAIDALQRAIEKTNSQTVRRALRLKLTEAHLENDDSTSAIAIATQLMTGD